MRADELKTHEFTPLEEQIISTLVARYRLGEHEWTIARNRHTTAALKRLEQLGAVRYRNHVVAGHWYARFTEAGHQAWTANPYLSPLQRELDTAREEIKGLRTALQAAYTQKD